jgi:hypothetical protein
MLILSGSKSSVICRKIAPPLILHHTQKMRYFDCSAALSKMCGRHR